VKSIQRAFPALPPGFYDIFSDRLKANGFCDERIKDAVSHVIDTCPYPTPTIANFISFDKKIKLYTYQEMVKKSEEWGPGVWETFKAIKLPGHQKPVWVNIDEAKRTGMDHLLTY